MPADYEKIREENIRRYGWDTAVLDLLGQLYSDRTHFIFELIQNAEDAGATELAFELFADRLEVWHDGRLFTEADVRGVCGVGQSAKAGDLTTIGKFGIGFKSVYAYTRSPRIHSGGQYGASEDGADEYEADEYEADEQEPGEHFRIESFVRPFPIEPGDGYSDGTLLVFPLDHEEVSAQVAVAEISAALSGLDLTTLLFLRNIESVRTGGVNTADQVLRRVTVPDQTLPDHTLPNQTLPDQQELAGGRHHVVLTSRGERDRGERDRGDVRWRVWRRSLDALGQPGQDVEIAMRVAHGDDGPRLVRCQAAPLVVFFPTEKETFLGCLIQGPYRTTPARDNVPEQDPWNLDLVRETAALLADVLRELRDEGLLTAEVLTAMPLDPARFQPGTLLAELFDSVRGLLAAEELIPRAGGGYGAAPDLRLTDDGGLRELLSAGQLGELFGVDGSAGWADLSSAEDHNPFGQAGQSGVDWAAVLRGYLREEAGVGEVTPHGFAAALTGEFLAAQPDLWTADLYAFLLRHRDLWQEPAGLALSQPIIRLEDGSQVAPFDASGRPAAYLPVAGPPDTGLRTVRRVVTEAAGARELLEALGFAEPDVVSEVLDGILPRYDGLEAEQLDPGQHDADLESVVRALAEAPAGRRGELLTRLHRTTFLAGRNAASGERRLMTPPSLYQRTKELETYFEGNPEAWFADDAYGPWRSQLRGMGVREEVGLTARDADASGHVVVAADFARHERGLDGFDPDADFDGLEFALSHPDQARSEYVWNTLLTPHRQLIAGVVEKATRQGYQDARREHVRSVAGAVVTDAAWLPGPGGTFRRPGELQLDDLPPTYQRDEGLAAALGMIQASVEAASRQLGIPAGVLRGLGQHSDLVAMVERELKNRGWDGHR
ncbi:MAG: sacsin N-terminal ATP-binding-like domain-containing protein [Streptosporangiaceae bacterium]